MPNVMEERKNEILNQIDNLLPGIKILSEENLTLLGAPLTTSAIGPIIDNKMKNFSNFIRKLKDIHPHVALHLLQRCLWIPKFSCLLRCCPLFNFKNHLDTMDKEIKNALEDILNIQLNENSFSQCFLPIKSGGLGIRLISDVALPAFLSSFNSTYTLVSEILYPAIVNVQSSDYENALDKWHSMYPNENFPTDPNAQTLWDLPLIKEKTAIVSNYSIINKARMLAVSQKESGGWLEALPSPHLGTLLDFDSIRIASGLRLGVELCQPYTCICGYPVDSTGTHALSCIKKKGSHIILNDLLSKGLSSAGIPTNLEPRGLIRKDGKRPDGITLTPWKNGKCLVWDATCVDTVASSYLKLTSKKPGAVANQACAKKDSLYEEISVKHHFLPFAVETFGSYSDAAKKFVQQLGRILIDRSGNLHAKEYFNQRISLAIQRGNVAAILGTLPSTAKIEEIFYLPR